MCLRSMTLRDKPARRRVRHIVDELGAQSTRAKYSVTYSRIPLCHKNWSVIFVSFVGAFRANGFLEAEEERAGADLEPNSTLHRIQK
jgi:hypothetical protein